MLQKVQNKAARVITRLDIFTKIEDLLNQIGWLSVRQLIAYHSLVLVRKILSEKCPLYIHEKISCDTLTYNTRYIAQHNIRKLRSNMNATHALSQQSFRWRASNQWNELPIDIKTTKTLSNFKLKLRKWIKERIPIY